MPAAVVGLFTGLALTLIAAVGGGGAFLLALVLGSVGLVVGLVIDGRIDLASILSGFRRG
ncbi:hypothetical protein [Actinotalea sp.]|uniref:hypothetical protein n=1 Tax=Actinotalea sp. TaxID=1872145 RepID=UPI00356220EF